MNQKILAFTGYKQSGKDSSGSYINKLVHSSRIFSFAGPLKQMCVDILGVEERQVYGTDDDKNSIVPHLLWQNFPLPAWETDKGEIFIEDLDTQFTPDVLRHNHDGPPFAIRIERWQETKGRLLVGRKTGPMTARQVMQYYGSNIFRKQFSDVWVEATMRAIKKDGCGMAIITDARFPNEVEAVKGAGGKVIRLTRRVFENDNHISEISLDPDRYDWSRFDSIINNKEMTLDEQRQAVVDTLRGWDYL